MAGSGCQRHKQAQKPLAVPIQLPVEPTLYCSIPPAPSLFYYSYLRKEDQIQANSTHTFPSTPLLILKWDGGSGALTINPNSDSSFP